MALLELLASRPGAWRLEDIVQQLRLTPGAGGRLLAVLGEQGYVHRREPDGDYVLAWKLAALGLKRRDAIGGDMAQHVLDGLAASSGELVRLGVIDDGRAVWVGAAPGHRKGLWCEAGPEPQASLCLALRQIPMQGYAVARDCGEDGVASMAVPVSLGPRDEALMFLGITGPSLRMTEERMDAIAPFLLAAAAELSALGSASPMLNRVCAAQ